MKIKHHIGINDKNSKFQKLLDKYKLKYKITMNIVTVDVYEDDYYWEEIQKFIIKNKVSDIVEMVFTKKELGFSEWFTLRSGWYWDYPQPDSDMGFREVTYDAEQYCSDCGALMKQKDCFRIRGEPNWGNKSIL